jgi:hypothetical protein
LEVQPQGDPFAILPGVKAHHAIEDAYLSGVRLRAVGRADRAQDARLALARLGVMKDAEPSLEDVFVSLARRVHDTATHGTTSHDTTAQTQVTQ